MTRRVERGQRNKQGRMEKEANQLYRRPQMTGQARDEEEEEESRVGVNTAFMISVLPIL